MKNTRTLDYLRQTNRETKENQRDKKGKILLLFNKVGKGCVLDKGRKVITEVVKNSCKGSFIREVYFIFFDNLKVFHEIFRCKVYFVNYTIPVLFNLN